MVLFGDRRFASVVKLTILIRWQLAIPRDQSQSLRPSWAQFASVIVVSCRQGHRTFVNGEDVREHGRVLYIVRCRACEFAEFVILAGY